VLLQALDSAINVIAKNLGNAAECGCRCDGLLKNACLISYAIHSIKMCQLNIDYAST
jgi:hypothetical protein